MAVGATAALVASVALLDSLNPSTVVPALYLAGREHARRRVAGFALGVFVVSTAGGMALLFGPGRNLLARIAQPSAHIRHVIELATGVVFVVLAVVLCVERARVRRLFSGEQRREGRSFLLGAGIMAVELPTAFPYFVGILATLEGVHGASRQVTLVALYNAVFVAPLLIALALAGSSYPRRASALLALHAPVVLPVGVACIGIALAVGGARSL